MPCSDWGREQSEFEEQRKRNKTKYGLDATDEGAARQAACEAFRLLHKHGILEKGSKFLQKWAKNHEAEDEKAGR